ncbi:hypothetical protein Cob_v012750 [Colletotrichum orbiculare MAFF 240422]|uniref:DUF7600 domain-containing protein n=1 Tax=Colletotrichum orbiculare (strain 104-T / ATCC 96160 / CBS 514.97 / LARS 414 / MAFF 240422) TaxID=1213857 RepID=A0A484F9P4_COLOR|nr:hypothetical protein Cob_v012750 [Colletotrichum orbiculare MAFF 240422]
MSPRLCACTLCGCHVFELSGISWKNQFRGVVSSPNGVFLTGVGVYDDPGRGAFIAPADPNVRWDDTIYDSPEEDQFGAMRQGEVNGKHGFIFHEACWCVLAKAFHPRPVPKTRLYDVCNSLPFPMNGTSLSWGHDYDGPVAVDNEHHFPWEDRYADRDYAEPYPAFTENPYDVSEAETVLAEAVESPPNRILPAPASKQQSQDLFHTLPRELRWLVAMYLPTHDALNLRLASPVFWDIFDSQQFWASRFAGDSARSWLFEARNNTQFRDWRWLYRRTSDARIGLGLQNRVRVWKLAQRIVDMLDFRWVDTGEVRQVGYWGEVERAIEVSSIFGFNAAVGSRGIQALQCVAKDGGIQHWLGGPEGSPKTRRLGTKGRVTDLEVGFDGCKIVHLAVYRQLFPPAEQENRLRNSGLWYPEIPASTLCLNEDSFLPRDHYMDGYKPLFWTSFGGPGGIYLRNLTELSVTWGGGGIRRIDFVHNTSVPREHGTFGCQPPEDWAKNIKFSIDGPGGEFIDTIDVFQHYPEEGYPWMLEEGILVALKVFTNRDRSCLFSLHAQPPGSQVRRIAVAQGTVITGFYGCQRSHDGSGVTALGVISEVPS